MIDLGFLNMLQSTELNVSILRNHASPLHFSFSEYNHGGAWLLSTKSYLLYPKYTTLFFLINFTKSLIRACSVSPNVSYLDVTKAFTDFNLKNVDISLIYF
uniref:(northern house mosquito) hypothetical protein n=1 Tax=Culex pipiens TaxID=7175 RepID=A0A8D8CEV7_CULPI